jgi:hypothetical protein
MAATKKQSDWSYGLPSGHVSGAASFFLALAFFFRSRGVFVFAVCWIILMALSRMYLGRHFIADVLGGVAVGTFAVAVVTFLVYPLKKGITQTPNYAALLRWAAFVLGLVVLAPFIDLLDKENIGRQLGLFGTYALLLRIGFPSDKGNFWKRSARVIIAILAYMAIDQIVNPIIDSIGLDDNSLGMLVAVFLITFSSFLATVFIAMRLKLYEEMTHSS